MRVVVVTPLRQPDPSRDQHGIYQRLGLFLHGLHRICDEIEIVHFAPLREIVSSAGESATSSDFWGMPVNVKLIPLEEQARSPLQSASLPFSLRHRGDFRQYLGARQVSALSDILSELPDLIFVQQLQAMAMLQQVPHIKAPIFFDLNDVNYRMKWRAGQTAGSRSARLRNYVQVPAIMAAERRGIARATRAFVCSDFDRTALSKRQFDVSRISVVHNAIEVPSRRPDLSARQSILLLGNYSYPPNAEAAERLITRVWPKIRSRANLPVLIVAGDHPYRIPSFHQRPPDVEFTGFVRDLGELYARARIVCCPIGNGGGTRLKIIEAAGYGKPIVATRVAIEGLEFSHDQEALVHDDDDELASSCVRLLQDDVLADELAASAFHKARSLYSRAELPEKIAREFAAGLAYRDGEQRGAGSGRDFSAEGSLEQLAPPLSAPHPHPRRENR